MWEWGRRERNLEIIFGVRFPFPWNRHINRLLIKIFVCFLFPLQFWRSTWKTVIKQKWSSVSRGAFPVSHHYWPRWRRLHRPSLPKSEDIFLSGSMVIYFELDLGNLSLGRTSKPWFLEEFGFLRMNLFCGICINSCSLSEANIAMWSLWSQMRKLVYREKNGDLILFKKVDIAAL